ncbi:DUF1801 domain-containing protein [Marilutibacter chinensis]|uniref:DUF1801 domain-containing protein n=1 Tax=Marilutibacter chinensis TaxID=2912247 RepID=A0ABS9HQG1_9GAMM|nr:DUF1801 domain-containing protein [Lysobacter chinensis]MCF7220751.1 DUF1801 domain-containing protein [Lysobacter chinensis]
MATKATRNAGKRPRSATKKAARKPTRTPAKKAAAQKSASRATKQTTKKTATKKTVGKAKKKPATKRAKKTTGSGPRLLSGGNPQIPKGEGNAPVRAYLQAIPGWKRAVARRLDTLIGRTVPGVRKAVKWNSPFYGAPRAEGWFLSFHCYDRYIKVTFFRGESLHPVPPEASKVPDVRYVHLREGDAFDARQLTDWVEQASRLPGEKM